MLWKLMPLLCAKFPVAVWYLIGFVLLIHIASYIVAAVKYQTFASLHTILNKLTGLLVFLLPYFIAQPFVTVYGWITAIAAGAASMEELVIHLSGRGYHPDQAGIWKQINKQEENEL